MGFEFGCVELFWIGELLTTEQARRRQQMYDELSSGGRFSSALLVVREHLPSGKACLRMNIDGTRIGNVARFINHSCDGGNLLTVLVRSSGALLPRLSFFASKNIQEDEELTFSYGDIRIREKGLPCFCGSSCCFGVLPSENTWLQWGKEKPQVEELIVHCHVSLIAKVYDCRQCAAPSVSVILKHNLWETDLKNRNALQISVEFLIRNIILVWECSSMVSGVWS